ncbi:MAG: 3-deoxy-D-manno-octulosonic acid transferase [Pyrinomonadaceae bacterium]
MFILYSFLLTIGFIILLPRFLFEGLRNGKYADGFWQRFGYLPDFKADNRPVLWLHCVSVGETNAAHPIVTEILKEFPNYRLVISTTTKTGQDLARKIFADRAELVFYFPFDWRFSVRRALQKIKPNIILIMETELWFNFLREGNRSGARIFIVNGRLSEKSFKRYLLIRKMMSHVFHYVDLALMQDFKDAKRLYKLGIRSSKVKITGNIKFDQTVEETESELTKEFRRRFAVSKDEPLIVAASTHAPEEALIIESFREVWKKSEGKLPRLLLAPRHPERFGEVAALIKNSGFDWIMRSEEESNRDKTAEVILLDSVGELRAVFPLAEIVFVGGSLIPHGGQNILEPALEKKPIVTGFYTMNFAEIVKEFLARDALVQLPELNKSEVSAKLAAVFSELLQDTEKRKELGEKAFAIVQKNRGATEKTLELLRPHLFINSNL